MRNSKVYLSLLLAVCLDSGTIFAQYTMTARTDQILNNGWKFLKQNAVGVQAINYPGESAMSSINLPHSFDIPYWRADVATSPTVGWYRKHITVDQSVLTSGKRVFLEFEAAFLVSTVYVNATLVGTHRGGYTGFSYDITSQLVAGDNVIAVKVDGTWNAQVAPRAGEHIFVGGMYRSVHLVMTDPLHVTWYGTFVTTPGATAASATVRVKTEIKNNAATSKTCRVVTSIVNAQNTLVTSFESTLTLAAGQLDTFVQASSPIANPQLWMPDTISATPPATPLDLNKRAYLYKVYTEVYDGASKVDDYVSPLGIRTVVWNKASGFVLNGKKLWLKGTNVHQDHAGWGDAICNTGAYRDVKILKDAGFNFIRGSHYPHAVAYSNACDSLGIIFWQEIPLWGIGGFGPGKAWAVTGYPSVTTDQTPFEDNVMQQMEEMIRIHRNHPSIAIWSMGNEPGYSDATVLTNLRDLMVRMQTRSHELDSTRMVGAGYGYGGWGTVAGATEVVGLNWNSTNCAENITNAYIPMISESDNENFERGDTRCVLPQGASAFTCSGTTYNLVTVRTFNGSNVNTHTQFSWRPGVSKWCSYDHGSNYAMGNMGFCDHMRIPKREYYYYRMIYAGIALPTWPVSGTPAKLVMTKDRDTITADGTSDVHLVVQVQDASSRWLTQSPAITLTDASGLGIFPSTATGSPAITLPANTHTRGVIEGMTAMEYRAYNCGTATITASSAGLTPATVTVVIKGCTGVRGLLTCARSLKPFAAPLSAVLKINGNSLAIPASMQQRKVSVALYNLQGRLVSVKMVNKKAMVNFGTKNIRAKGILIAKLHTVD